MANRNSDLRFSEEEDAPLIDDTNFDSRGTSRRDPRFALFQRRRKPSKPSNSSSSNSSHWVNSLSHVYSSSEKIMFIFVLILLILVFVFGNLYASSPLPQVSYSLLNNCGGWIKKNPIPDDKSSVGTFSILAEDNIQTLRTIFDLPYKYDHSLSGEDLKFDEEVFGKAQTLYKTCLNETQIEIDGINPLVEILNELVLPLSDESGNLDSEKLVSTLALALKTGITGIYNTFVDADNKNPDENRIQIEQAGITLPSKDYYVENPDVVAVFKQVIEEIFAIIGPSVQTIAGRDWNVAAQDVVDVETKLASIQMTPEELENPSVRYHPMKISELQLLCPHINWLSHFNLVFPSEDFPKVISPETVVVVNSDNYFGNLSSILVDLKHEAVENYIAWMSISSYAKYTNKEIRQISKKLGLKLGTAATLDPPRWKTCINEMDSNVGYGAGKWFVNAVFSGDSKTAAEKTIQAIKNSMIKRVPDIDWIDKSTGDLAISKIKSLKPKIGFPDEIMNPVKMHEKYLTLNLHSSQYLNNIVSTARFHTSSNLNDILIPVDRSRWGMTPPTVNAYYNPPMNEIAFPAGILQPPFYSASDPQYLNFGAIGMVVGHEITHAFDNNGRQFDSEGRMIDWWSNETAVRFDDKTQCFIEQYGNYKVTGPDGTTVNVNGKLTLGENLADNGGLSRAFEAWKQEMESLGRRADSINQFLPGLQKYTREQLFFVGFGEVWCQAITPAAALRRVRIDPHSPNRMRVHGAVQNSKYFRDAFQCKDGQKMSPVDRCEICLEVDLEEFGTDFGSPTAMAFSTNWLTLCHSKKTGLESAMEKHADVPRFVSALASQNETLLSIGLWFVCCFPSL
ncbi:Peptidase M13 [Nowakowskiella sp. JEL0078]|nr:Peptidase M13 [Nowakowskiella sp. JEL0078]